MYRIIHRKSTDKVWLIPYVPIATYACGIYVNSGLVFRQKDTDMYTTIYVLGETYDVLF